MEEGKWKGGSEMRKGKQKLKEASKRNGKGKRGKGEFQLQKSWRPQIRTRVPEQGTLSSSIWSPKRILFCLLNSKLVCAVAFKTHFVKFCMAFSPKKGFCE